MYSHFNLSQFAGEPSDLRLYDFENSLPGESSLIYKIKFRSNVIYASQKFRESENSTIGGIIEVSLTEEDIRSNEALEIVFQQSSSGKELGSLKMPLSYILRRSILPNEFRIALKIKKSDGFLADKNSCLEKVCDETKEECSIAQEENERQKLFINEVPKKEKGISHPLGEQMTEDLFGVLVLSMMMRLDSDLFTVGPSFDKFLTEGFFGSNRRLF